MSSTCILNIREVAVHSTTAHEHGLRRRHLSAIHRLQGWVLCSVRFFYKSPPTTFLYRLYVSRCIYKNALSRTTCDSRHTPSTAMLQQTPRTSDIDNGECSHHVPDAVEMDASAHATDYRDPYGCHARPLSAAGALWTAQITPVHPPCLCERHRAGCHWEKQTDCTSESVEIVNVVVLRPKLYHATRHHQRYNFTQCADVGRASARPQCGPRRKSTL